MLVKLHVPGFLLQIGESGLGMIAEELYLTNTSSAIKVYSTEHVIMLASPMMTCMDLCPFVVQTVVGLLLIGIYAVSLRIYA